MSSAQTLAIVLAAGMGTRMQSKIPKVLHTLAGRPIIDHILASLAEIDIGETVVLVGPELEKQADRFAPHSIAVQSDRLGTGHAVKCAVDGRNLADKTVLIVYGDVPLLKPETISLLLDSQGNEAALALLAFRPADPSAYGRVITDGGQVDRIVEFLDATPKERALTLCNSGVMAVDGSKLGGWLDALKNENAKKEYYLTDVIALARKDGEACLCVEGDADEFAGINSRRNLAEAETLIQERYRSAAMDKGVTLQNPDSVFLSYDTTFGQDVHVGPFTVFGPGVTVGDNVTIKGFCHFEGATIDEGATIGPYARLRPGAKVEEAAHIGNFVEIKNARIEPGAKVSHLTYVGDARVGQRANVGAGTITANYDGFNKSHTDIGRDVSIGSNTVLVAPVTVGDGAITGAGAVIRKDVPADAIAINKARQENREGAAGKYKNTRKAIKDLKSEDR